MEDKDKILSDNIDGNTDKTGSVETDPVENDGMTIVSEEKANKDETETVDNNLFSEDEADYDDISENDIPDDDDGNGYFDLYGYDTDNEDEIFDDDAEPVYDDTYINRRAERRQIEARRAAQVDRQKKIIVIGVPVVIVIIIVIAVFAKLKGGSGDTEIASGEVSSNENTDVSTDDTSSEDDTTQTDNGQGLQKNTDEEIDNLVNKYFTALSTRDIESLEECVDDIGDITAESLQATAQYIEGYENIECYTKPGLEDNEYVVYVYYENKILNIETLAPGATTLYVIKDADAGTAYIHNGVTSGEIASYIQTVSAEDDVIAFFADVNDKLSAACDSDADLKAFYDGLINGTESQDDESGSDGGSGENGGEDE